MDIRNFSVELTGRLPLLDAADQPMFSDGDPKKPMAVRLHSPGSKQYAAAQAAQHNRMVDKLKRKGKAKQTAEEQAQEKAEFLADCTEGFDNVEYENLTGRELAVAIYSDTGIGFIADQVAKFLGDWGNFTKSSASS